MGWNVLEIRGEGTWEVESLSSHLHRMAESHGVGIDAFLCGVLQRIDERKGEHPYYRNMEALEQKLEAWLPRLELLHQSTNWRAMTFGGLRALVSLNCECREFNAVCPICLEEGADEHGGAYCPLIWRLKSYRICIKHLVKMVRLCMNCGSRYSKIFYAGSRNGCCSRCRKWMGRLMGGEKMEGMTLNHGDLRLSVCTAELLSLCQSEESWVRARSRVSQLVQEVDPSSLDATSLSQTYGVEAARTSKEPQVWRPTLAEWSDITEMARTSLPHLLLDRPCYLAEDHVSAHGRNEVLQRLVRRVVQNKFGKDERLSPFGFPAQLGSPAFSTRETLPLLFRKAKSAGYRRAYRRAWSQLRASEADAVRSAVAHAIAPIDAKWRSLGFTAVLGKLLERGDLLAPLPGVHGDSSNKTESQ
ncbi:MULTISPECIES: TniQ family protein [unclassified Caballeronia]|uniref:TniQ family protein n=1 Tax=unclassified Caballeronia TaxID=2646786 RepID=UPI0032EEE980